MWLLNTSTLALTEFFGSNIPKYAILSHTWGSSEVTFYEIQVDHIPFHVKQKSGFKKMSQFCRIAKSYGWEWAWMDSCCIDKRSSAELSEAINSMYMWYQEAQICIIYLEDVPSLHGLMVNLEQEDEEFEANDMIFSFISAFRTSKWFTRGWTLQELLAPKKRVWMAENWSPISAEDFQLVTGSRLMETVSATTRISEGILEDNTTLQTLPISERMRWASRRQTTRSEDGAYCLMGLFGVNMPVLYGEGLERAFRRLQSEIMKISFDQSIFAWNGPYKSSGLLAHSPSDFENTPGTGQVELRTWSKDSIPSHTHFVLTNVGLQIRCWISDPDPEGIVFAGLQCHVWDVENEEWAQLYIKLRHVPYAACWINGTQYESFRRVDCQERHLASWYWEEFHYEDLLVLEDSQFAMVDTSGRISDDMQI